MEGAIEGRLLAGRYRVGAAIGSGALSVVHEGQDLRLVRNVALKFIKHDDSEELTERLFREAKAAARSNHPAVFTVFGYGTDTDTDIDFLVMERLQGEDLATRLAREGRVPSDTVLRLGAVLADALACVHDAGVVHRDLKPASIYLARNGLQRDALKLLDFGVAKQVDLHTLTATGQVIGTAAYMAPEQILDSKRADARADIYAAGVVMYECLFGRRPYRTATMAELAQRVFSDAKPEFDVSLAAVPADVIEIVSRCLRRSLTSASRTRAVCAMRCSQLPVAGVVRVARSRDGTRCSMRARRGRRRATMCRCGLRGPESFSTVRRTWLSK